VIRRPRPRTNPRPRAIRHRDCAVLRRDDDDFGQAGTMVREVLDDAARDRLVSNVVGHLRNGVTEPVLVRNPASRTAEARA
jgi:catalase